MSDMNTALELMLRWSSFLTSAITVFEGCVVLTISGGVTLAYFSWYVKECKRCSSSEARYITTMGTHRVAPKIMFDYVLFATSYKGSMYKVMKTFVCTGCVNPVTSKDAQV